ncbi:MAG TPA: hypothetical protein VFV72_02535 [Candidatus Limnocylindrales bacterium]|nr:hypothetical protein [Candidatus Limnocylindrales bacterium]
MSISRYLNHRVAIVASRSVLDDQDEPTVDEYGQPVRADVTVASNVAAGIQPKSERELAAISQAGVAESTHTIYMLPRLVSTADTIVHDPDDCPLSVDLPAARYLVTGVPDAAGAGHHLEIDARLLGAPVQASYDTPVGIGS